MEARAADPGPGKGGEYRPSWNLKTELGSHLASVPQGKTATESFALDQNRGVDVWMALYWSVIRVSQPGCPVAGVPLGASRVVALLFFWGDFQGVLCFAC